MKTLTERFNEKWMPEPNSGCHLWTHSTDASGYGQIEYKGRNCRTHRLAWEFHNGQIPKGLHVLHTCDTPSCCRIDHLFLGTNKDNVDDMVKKRRHRHHKTTHCPAGHEYSGDNLLKSKNGSRVCRECGRKRSREYIRARRARANVRVT